MVTLEEVVDVDYLVLAVPLDAYTETLEAIKPIVKPHTVIVDVCSVKVKPVETIRSIMPDQPLVATHPMFGPESASVSFAGHTFVMCPEVSTTEPYENIKHFANSLGLGVVEMSADEHDREIAVVPVSYTHLDVYKRQGEIMTQRTLPDNAILIPDNASCVFRGVLFDVYQWQQKMFDGSHGTFEMLRRPDTIAVVAIDDDGKIIACHEEQPGGVLRQNHITVSYTHLDVYKRQGKRR